MPIEDLSYFEEEEFKKNLALYEQMLQNGQSVYLEADELTDIAEYYIMQNETDKAMACINYALSIHPDSIDPLIFLARQKMFDGDLEEARRIRNYITDQDDLEVIFFDAELLLREGKVQEAEDLLNRAAEKENDDEAYFAYDTAVLFLDYGYLEQASKWGKEALELEPENEKFIKFKADLLIAYNRPEEAATLLNKLLDNMPYNQAAWHSLGEAYFTSEDFQKAMEAADFALAIDENDAQALLLKANCHLQLQNYKEAHALYTQYLKKYAANEMPYLFDGACLNALGRPDEALKQLLKANELSQGFSPEQHHIYANISDVYSRLHQLDKAFEYVDKIKELNPDYDADLHKGHILMQNGEKDKALEYYDTFIRHHENTFEAHLLVGVSMMENKDYDEAWQHFSYILVHDRDENDESRKKVYAYLSYCALMQGNYKEFISYLRIACEKAPEALEYTVGQFIPEEVEVKDFYHYVMNHSDWFLRFNTDRSSF